MSSLRTEGLLCAALWWVVFSGAVKSLAAPPHDCPNTVDSRHPHQTEPSAKAHWKVNHGVLSLFIYFPHIKMCLTSDLKNLNQIHPSVFVLDGEKTVFSILLDQVESKIQSG